MLHTCNMWVTEFELKFELKRSITHAFNCETTTNNNIFNLLIGNKLLLTEISL